MTRAILIIGGGGFLGSHLALRLRESYKVFATYYTKPLSIKGVTCLPFNLSNRNWMKRVFYSCRPDIIIYAVGKNDVDWAEAHPREVEGLNTSGPATVLNVAEILQPKFIYLSNSYTFDGARGNYHESDVVVPSTLLGKSKISGENAVRGRSLNYAIIRSAPVFGRGNGRRQSWFDQLRMTLDRNRHVQIAADETHNYAPVSGLVDLVEEVISRGVKNQVFHYGGLTKVSHFDFARQFATRFGYNPDLILPPKETTPGHAPAKASLTAVSISHADYSLNFTRTVQNLQVKPFLLEEGFDLIEKQLVPVL